MTEAELDKALKAARKECERFQKLRYEARQVRDRKTIEDSDADFQACLDEINDLERRLGRLRAPGSGPGQAINVGAATEGNSN